MAYATLSELRTYLGFASSNTDDDTLLAALITRAQKVIDLLAGCSFEATSATRYYDPTVNVTATGMLALDADLLTVTSITNGDGDVLTASEYVLWPSNSSPKRGVKLKASTGLYWTYNTDPENAITIVGTWGLFATAPADITQATLRLAAYMYRQKDAQVFDVTASPETGVITIPQGIPKDVRLTINAYKRML
jgi:hypothetical protein